MSDEKKHILESLNLNLRYDGRKLTDYRAIVVEKNVVKNAEGSARVKIGNTEVIAGVKMSLEKPFPDTPDEGMLMVGAELLPMSNPEFELGPPGIQAIELARVVDRGIRESKSVDLKKLAVAPGEKVWGANIDIVSINDEGNLLDASALAAIAALQEVKFPELDGDKVNYKKLTTKTLPMKITPVSVTVSKIGNHLLVDPSTEEERSVDARLTVALTEKNIVCAMQKGGDMPITDKDVDAMITLAMEKSRELRKFL
ncbi:MAG: exosome complex component RRP42 [archaeon GW2011_AR3]|nr:MAG: exosome complex component RRP42 [archaeon GW2011_AR3]MBS3108940.1 exosome complex protein Rrp42 [Candidatus Woesearchaeota archaeon]